MKINKLKINSYGKLKDKEISLNSGINLIYGQNESGKSTLINFIINSFYGISKNKRGKEVSNFEKYMPWFGEEFSGRIDYELDNGETYEVFRDFRKKSPKIFNSNMEDISKQFNIDKNKGNEFFYEQTKIDEELFLSTLAINQTEVKLESQEQNLLIQKMANLAQTGDDSTSFKIVIDRINRRQLDEVGTDRSREKPINLIEKKLQELIQKREELEQYKNLKYEFEERENEINQDISNLENESKVLQEEKISNEAKKVEIEKLRIEENVKKQNIEKIDLLNKELSQVKLNYEKTSKNKKVKKLNVFFIILLLVNIFQFIFVPNKLFKYIFLVTIPMFLIFYYNKCKKIKKQEKINKKNFDKVNSELVDLENEKNLIEGNNRNLDEELNKINANLNEINYKIEKNRKDIYNKTIELHTLELDKKNIEPQLDNLSKIEEQIVDSKDKMKDLEDLNFSMNLAKEVLTQSYENMKNSVTPKFTENLSVNISKITDGKYKKVMFNENEGLLLELENGDYVPVNRLSIGTIDQLYLSLRLSMIDDLSEEIVPVLLDEAFAFYDDERLENVLLYLSEILKGRQIVIFTCTNREKDILNKKNISYNYITL